MNSRAQVIYNRGRAREELKEEKRKRQYVIGGWDFANEDSKRIFEARLKKTQDRKKKHTYCWTEVEILDHEKMSS